MKEWVKHMDNITELVPIEVMIIMCLLMWFTFKVARILYSARRAHMARTRLLLEIGNGTDMILIHIMDLPHTSRHYRLIINRAEVAFQLIKTHFSTKLAWDRGVILYNTALDMAIPLPTAVPVVPWKIKLLKSLLEAQHYALIQVVSGKEMDIINLRSQNDLMMAARSFSAPSLYPALA